MMIGCKEASALVSKKIDRGLSFSESLKLKFHNLICATCRLFQKEVEVLDRAMKEHSIKDVTLNDVAKEKMESTIHIGR